MGNYGIAQLYGILFNTKKTHTTPETFRLRQSQKGLASRATTRKRKKNPATARANSFAVICNGSTDSNRTVRGVHRSA